MTKTITLAAFLAASSLALIPVGAFAQDIHIGVGGAGGHGDDSHRGAREDRHVVEDTHGGHANQRHETSHDSSHESSHGDRDRH